MSKFPWRVVVRLAAVVGAIWLAVVPSVRAVADTPSVPLRSWTVTGVRDLPAATADEGVTVVTHGGDTPAGDPDVVTRGSGSIPAELRQDGWVHVGDPGTFRGAVVDAYQGRAGSTVKLFTVTSGDRRYRYLHRLVRGERFNNSFAAVSPDGRWLLSGEWNTQSRLLLFPMPRPTATASRSGALRLRESIRLTRPVRDVQGCAFASATSLLCSTDDPGTDLFAVARQVLRIRFAHPLTGVGDVGTPTLVGSAPRQTLCPGDGEVEGLDLTAGRLRIAVNAPCADATELFTLQSRPPT